MGVEAGTVEDHGAAPSFSWFSGFLLIAMVTTLLSCITRLLRACLGSERVLRSVVLLGAGMGIGGRNPTGAGLVLGAGVVLPSRDRRRGALRGDRDISH